MKYNKRINMIELIEGKKHLVIKRNQTTEKYDPNKMYNLDRKNMSITEMVPPPVQASAKGK